ncbi:MAG TPA: tRNA (cytidine(34)-2'-O)-methyltransferase [Pseudobdellovibrionaceae bacterium]|nr:tRNA (cytidine(34)-2'-O)-methyltransferase [Pseudobdellovibrionaceae bacterium]
MSSNTRPFLPPQQQLADPLARVVLVEPLIPENTGNISRTCVATGSELHLVGPMGFEITESRLKRAGLDYWPHLALDYHEAFEAWWSMVESKRQGERVYFIETSGTTSLFDVEFQRGDWLVFGKETSGLSPEQLARRPKEAVISLPMPGPVRSLNLSNAVAITVFELMRQVCKAPTAGR